ncbi:hypothetical protein ACN4EK_08680 [Pantanalinema rosaneae CENA516]|uniref:hypothetical protein n=1 Tax=Pantanalinema rosaneae TaxID=1620701 RepID=UPI003D6E6AB4
MNEDEKQLSNPFSTGGGGGVFEAHIQASFVVLMLAGGFSPCLPRWPINRIKLQGKYDGYATDDLIVFAESFDRSNTVKMLAQIKHSISITKNSKVLAEVLQAAWIDFNNSDIFTKGRDCIALITGPLSSTDTDHVRTILEWSRHSEDSEDFFKKVELANFSHQKKREKLDVFRHHLLKISGNESLPPEDLFYFLRHFHLIGYDLDIKSGVALSLLHSLIGQYSQEEAHGLWTQLIDEVQTANKNAGIVTRETVSDEIRKAFQTRIYETIPQELSKRTPPNSVQDWNSSQHASALTVANLIGSWDEQSEADRAIISSLARCDYSEWILPIREVLHEENSPLILKNGIWKVSDRLLLWQSLGQRIFDGDLDNLKVCAVNVLKEPDPQFELAPEDRFAAHIYGKKLAHSNVLRKGLAETFAILGTYPNALSNCSADKPEAVASLAVREILNEIDWVLWGSLNNLLPLISEASPDTFLHAIEAALQAQNCPFHKLFSQEGNGITGGNYLTGLLWALESLAWEADYLVRTTVILGELAERDPGGNWANRPQSSLTMIFLPWLPQTTAPIEKRQVAVKTLTNEVPEVAWKLLISLLPNQHQSSTGTHKPIWRRSIPEDWNEKVIGQDYWNQVSFYCDQAFQMAQNDTDKLMELIHYIDNLVNPVFENVIDYLASDKVTGLTEEERQNLWTSLVELTTKHRRYADADWALPTDLVSKLESVSKKLAPTNLLYLYRRLFANRELDLFEKQGHWDEQRHQLNKRRKEAIKEIFDYGGITAVLQFAEEVERPNYVGYALSEIDSQQIQIAVLPTLLAAENRSIVSFTLGYVVGCYEFKGWNWVDNVDLQNWTPSQVAQFFAYLPFTPETWLRVFTLLGSNESEYWKRVDVRPFQVEGDLETAVDKLIEHGRPYRAIDCLYTCLSNKEPLDQDRTVKALLAAASSVEPVSQMDPYHIEELIAALQNDPETDPNDLFHIEWAYLPLLYNHRSVRPRALEDRLSSDPEFFCEIIRLVYKAKGTSSPQKETTERTRKIAQNGYHLLKEWKIPPGTQPDGTFSGEAFHMWLKAVKISCKESGHLEVALVHVGQVLTHSKPDNDGLWINRDVAQALNAKDADVMRRGFRTATFNSRGVHWVDPTGAAEKALADAFNKKAEDLENAGYQRFAVTLRELAHSYERDARRIADEHIEEE